jgi:hypothetical protein
MGVYFCMNKLRTTRTGVRYFMDYDGELHLIPPRPDMNVLGHCFASRRCA